jgi:hypothetical protein
METELDGIRRRRQQLRSEFGPLYGRVSAVLFEEDPGEVNYVDNTDEYESEADLIVPLLRDCSSAQDVQRVVHGVFLNMFSKETANPPSRFRRISERIWTETSSLSVVRRPTGR